MKEVIMPRLGLNMEFGTVTKWLVEVGSRVKEGDILCEIESEKTVSEVRSEYDGVVDKIITGAGQDIEVLGVIALIRIQ
jgi:pyruvate/2-oxoglutarate dehydrogenase complex dihydrolipoamide acyltransferase (E2) component